MVNSGWRCLSGWWLKNTSEKDEFVSWDDEIMVNTC